MEAKKSFGQHFLRDSNVIAQIISAAEPSRFSTIVEVGPGRGALTDHLVPLAKRLVLLEADRDLIPDLQEKYPKAEIVLGDAAKTDWRLVTGDWCLVGNLPYNAANAILMHALQAPEPPERAVIMVQKEVGERMLALPGHMSVLGVAVGLYATADRVCTVKPGAFVPPPKVDSMVVCLTTRRDRRPDIEDIVQFAKVGFAKRRKVLASNLAGAKLADPRRVEEWLVGQGLSPKARAEELSVAQWVSLYTFCR